MTSEVALLNRSAVALAADSATTVTTWEGGRYVTRYFKGTNKIFHISTVHPVGMMIYATASLQGAPWEVLIKSYRDEREGQPHDYLHEYATSLFDFISNNTHIFGTTQQEQQFKHDTDLVAARIMSDISKMDTYNNATDDAAKSTAVAARLVQIKSDIDTASFVGNIEQNDLDAALAKYTTTIRDMLENDPYYKPFFPFVDLNTLATTAISGQLKENYTNLSNTGIVITGFGEKDYFPRLVAYRCYGFIPGKLIFSEEISKQKTIDQNNGSEFVTFAQDNMMRTFIFGISGQMLVELDSQFETGVGNFYEELKKEGLAADISGDPAKNQKLEEIKRKEKDEFGQRVINYSINAHSHPMRRVLGSLPFDELAELAETLVLLESLKERVTSPSSSVSGPIDVAVISKNDGFVWIKRKHYFDPKLNPRYFNRSISLGGNQ